LIKKSPGHDVSDRASAMLGKIYLARNCKKKMLRIIFGWKHLVRARFNVTLLVNRLTELFLLQASEKYKLSYLMPITHSLSTNGRRTMSWFSDYQLHWFSCRQSLTSENGTVLLLLWKWISYKSTQKRKHTYNEWARPYRYTWTPS